MHPRRLFAMLLPPGGVGLLCLCLSGGCGDDSKTTGTQVQISPEMRAELDDMKAVQKEVRAERKKAGRTGRPAD